MGRADYCYRQSSVTGSDGLSACLSVSFSLDRRNKTDSIARYVVPAAVQTLRRILRSTFSNEYYLISGDVGTGKTRSVVEVIRSMMADDGRRGLGAPIYVLANQGNSFAETLGAAVGFRFDEHISFRFLVDFLIQVGKDKAIVYSRLRPPRATFSRIQPNTVAV